MSLQSLKLITTKEVKSKALQFLSVPHHTCPSSLVLILLMALISFFSLTISSFSDCLPFDTDHTHFIIFSHFY